MGMFFLAVIERATDVAFINVTDALLGYYLFNLYSNTESCTICRTH